MKKIIKTIPFIFMLASCSNLLPTSTYEKVKGNNNFEIDGNLLVSDYKIDGILDDEAYEEATLTINMGGREDFKTAVEGKIVFGENGLLIGFYSIDEKIASSTDYNDPRFVVNSDNVEFYIDTLNDKQKKGQPDDYAFLVNPEEFIEMRNGTGSGWDTYSGVVDYAVHVDGTINYDGDIDTGWGCEIYLPYQVFGFNDKSTIGVAFGCRDKNSFESTSKWTGWGPDPQIIDTYVSINKQGVVTAVVEDLTINNGSYEYVNGEYNALTDDALGTLKEQTMNEGTFTVDMYLPAIGEHFDNGVTIQVNSFSDKFFEGIGVNYYFFAITHEGNALLGQTNNGVWTELEFKEDVSYVAKGWNTFKVVLANNYITCFLNDEFMFASPVASIGDLPFGLRAGMKSIKYRNISYSSSTDGAYVGIDGYHTAWGEYGYVEDNHHLIQSTDIQDNGAIIIANQEAGASATIETDMKSYSPSDNGIIFMLDDKGVSRFWENDVSYYFFFISTDGNAYLGRVHENQWRNMTSKPIADYDINNTYTLTVSYNAERIICYINGEERINVVNMDADTFGTKYGFRAGSYGVTFTI